MNFLSSCNQDVNATLRFLIHISKSPIVKYAKMSKTTVRIHSKYILNAVVFKPIYYERFAISAVFFKEEWLTSTSI